MIYEISKTIEGVTYTESFRADFNLDDADVDVAYFQGLDTPQAMLLYYIRVQFERPELFSDEELLHVLTRVKDGQFELELMD